MTTMGCDASHGARGTRASAVRARSGARMMRARGGGGGGGRCVVRCDARARTGASGARAGAGDAVRVRARASAAARMRAAAAVVVAASGMHEDEDEDEDDVGVGFGRVDDADDDDEDDVGTYNVRGGDGVSSLDGQFDSYMMSGSYGDDEDVVGRGGSGTRGARGDGADWDTSGGVPPDDIISESSQHWFDNSDEWYEPTYKEVNARKGSVLEKVQRMHLNEPSDFSFKDGEYFDLMGYVKEKTDNEFCLVLEVAERARERKIERLESLGPQRTERLGPIQQVRRLRAGRICFRLFSLAMTIIRIVEHLVANHADKTAPSISVANAYVHSCRDLVCVLSY